MYISSFSIDTFGIFSNVRVEDLSAGLNIFIGPNGAGKSTCMEFLLSLLTGRPTLSQLRPGLPGNSEAAGSLELIWHLGDGGFSSCQIAENAASERRLSGKSVEAQENFTKLMGILQPEEYWKIFGFGQGELEKFADSPEDKASSMLFGAAFGAGLRSPSLTQAALSQKMESIWGKPEEAGSISCLIREIETARYELGELETSRLSHDRLTNELLAAKKELALARANKSELESHKRLIQKRLDAWNDWRELQKILQLGKTLEDAPSEFPSDAIKRLELIMAARSTCEQQIASREARIATLATEMDKLPFDEGIMKALPALRRLAERKGSFNAALEQMDGLREKRDSLSAEMAECLESLGAGWTCERIHSMDRSLFGREKLEQLAEELTAGREAHQAAVAALAASNQEVSATERALAEAETALAAMPDPASELNAHEREELQGNIGRLKECRRQNLAREKNLENARHALLRALEQARIQPIYTDGQFDQDAISQAIDSLLNSREEALKIAEELQKHVSETELANERVTMLEGNAENLRKKMEDARAAHRHQAGAPETSINKRARALQTLRSNVSRIENAREKLDDIDSRIAETPKPAKSLRHMLVWPGIIFLLAGVGLFVACHFFNVRELGPGVFILPVSLPLSYFIAALGVLMLGLGLPAGHASKNMAKRQLDKLITARESGMMEIAVLDRENRNLAQEAGIENTDPITLDATEMLLEREKEQRIHEERSKQELQANEQELQEISNNIRQLKEDIRLQENDIQKCRKKWQSLLDRVHIGGSPSPESASIVFARVEACQIALENARNAENELNELWEDLHFLESAISSTPAVAKRLEEAKEPLKLEDAVHLVLESCKNANKMWEDKLQAQSAFKTVENELARARGRQEEAAKHLEEANSRQEQARENWRRHTADFGCGEQADPQTLREALRLMDKCLVCESSLEAVNRMITQNEAEMADVRQSLSSLLSELGLEPLMKRDNSPDWLATLDDLLARADHNAEIASERKRLDSLIASNREDLAASQAELTSLDNRENNLLKQAHADNREQFLKLAEKFSEKQALDIKRQEIENSLRHAAGDTNFEDFLSSFSNLEQEDAEAELAETQKKLDQLGDDEQKFANAAGLLAAKIGGLDQTGDLTFLRHHIASLESALHAQMEDWSKFALARALLSKAVKVYEKKKQPAIARKASEYFTELASSNWQGLHVNIEKKEITLADENGLAENPALVNRSLKEMAWFSLRFSFIREFAVKNASMPVFMDEILINLDPENMKRAVSFIADFSKGEAGEPQQIFYFTCHPELLNLFKDKDATAKIFRLDNGMIKRVE